MFKKLIILLLISFIFPQSLQDLRKMRSEYEKLLKNRDNIQIGVPDTEDRSSSNLPKTGEMKIFDFDKALDSLRNQSNFFGYDYFTRQDTISFWENLPAPSNYLLGPGDELIISLWGETELRESYIISREGKIYDQKIGIMNVSGKTIEEAKAYLLQQFGRYHSTLVGNKPSTFFDVLTGSSFFILKPKFTFSATVSHSNKAPC